MSDSLDHHRDASSLPSHPGAPGMAVWAATALAAGIVYSLTAARVIQWQDSGQFVLRIVTGDLVNELGLALAHPLHYWLGRAAVFGLGVPPPLAVSWVSAVAGAVAVANVALGVRMLTASTLPAVVAGGFLLVGNTFWRMSTLPECYTLTAALLTGQVLCLIAWTRSGRPVWWVVIGLLSGLSLANHNLALLALPVWSVCVVWAWGAGHLTWRTVGATAAAWIVGSLPYTGLIAGQAVSSGDLGATIHSALFGATFKDSVVSDALPWRRTGISGLFTLLSFPNLALPLMLIGLVGGWRRLSSRLRWPLLGIVLAHLLFVLRYDVIDQYTFLTPVYALLAIYAGVGWTVVTDRLSGRLRTGLLVFVALSLLWTPAVYPLAVFAAKRADALAGFERNKPYRDDYAYLLLPWGVAKTSAATLSNHAVRLAEPDGMILVEDRMARFAVEYTAHQKGLDKIAVVGPDGEAAFGLAAGRRTRVLVPGQVRDEAGYEGEWDVRGPLFVSPSPQDGP